MRVIVLGGTGLLGFHASAALRARGHEVHAVARRPGRGCRGVLDVLTCAEADLRAALQGADAVVQAFGEDDRHAQRRPAAPVYRRLLVESTRRVLEAARRTGVPRVVICGSFFTHLAAARGWPRHVREQPYIRARIEQAALALSDESGASVVLLELPFVFGRVPGRRSLWAPLVAHARGAWPLLGLRGGTTMIGVEDAAAGIANAAEGRVPAGRYPVGETSLSWRGLLEEAARLAGRPRRARSVPLGCVLPFTHVLECVARVGGWGHGVDRSVMIRLLADGFEVEEGVRRHAHEALEIAPASLEAALDETFRPSADREP